jgi:type IV pilus assembly protein PilF
MNATKRWQSVRVHWTAVLIAAAGLVLQFQLIGCASTQDSAVASNVDLMTDSDEPEARRRARIRLELAVGYFEQGKTTVALDEIKQSLANDQAYPDAYNLRGLIYMRLNDLQLAEDSFRRAQSLAPRDPNVMHNFGWLACQQGRYAQAELLFSQAVAVPVYNGRARTLMAQGLCHVRAGRHDDGEKSLSKAFDLDPANPIVGYNLASLTFQRKDYLRAQFYARRLNNSELANSESLWLGIKIEQRLGNRDGAQQLAVQLRKRFSQSKEMGLYDRGAFDE